MKYNERNRNVYLGKVCAQMYTMKKRGNEPTFSKNERTCAATIEGKVCAQIYTMKTRGIEPTFSKNERKCAATIEKYNERNRNVYLGKVCAQMYTMKPRGNEPTFSKNERKCAATSLITETYVSSNYCD